MSATPAEAPAGAMRKFSLEGKVAVVTGAGGLIGRRHCAALAAAGAAVVATDISAAAAEAGAAEAVASARPPVRPIAVAADITDRGSLEALRDATLRAFGRLDVLVNNAAINDKVEQRGDLGVDATAFEHFPLEEWRRVLDVNTTGIFLPCQVLGRVLAEQGSGSIINVASTYGLVGPDQALYVRPDGSRALWKSPAYPTSKGAVLAFTRYLAAYWGPRGVRVNTLVPGGVEAGQEPWFLANYARRTPLGRMAAADDYEGALVYLASDASAYMTGAALVVDGGFTAW
ncbi:MAG: SDR family oxidoreductase [Gemmatimonadales bacterium]|nr:SDR family oxidoreductase [Gemmatimonadales bacterium]